MSFSPSGALYLLGNVPFDNTYQNVRSFSSIDDQVAYFQGKVTQTLSNNNYTYIRKDSSIKVSLNVEALYNVNYVMYRNYATSKWIYAFVTAMHYINENNAELIIETDVYQTWLFNATLTESFVIREHVTDDTIGAHITDEGLDPGEYVRVDIAASGHLDNFKIMVAISYDSQLNTNLGTMYAGVYSGLSYLQFTTDSQGITDLNNLIESLANAGKSSIIAAIFMMPSDFISTDPIIPMSYDLTPIARPTNIQGYIPKNNKLFIYPYSLLYVSNNQGSGAVYRYEFFSNINSLTFKMVGEMSPSPLVYLMPENYKGIATNADEKLVLGNFPLCSWNNDVYSNFLAQNKNKLFTSAIANVATIAAGSMTDNAPMIQGGAMGVIGQLADVMDRSIQPAQAMGNLSGSGALSVGLQDFFFYPTTITREYAERLDKFFDMYGYKVNTVKTPNTNTRPYWNYVKCIDSNVLGEIPMADLDRLKRIYNEGVTIWHTDDIGNYSLNNH